MVTALYVVEVGDTSVEVTAETRQKAREIVWAWLGDSARATKLKTRLILYEYGFPRAPSQHHALYQSLT